MTALVLSARYHCPKDLVSFALRIKPAPVALRTHMWCEFVSGTQPSQTGRQQLWTPSLISLPHFHCLAQLVDRSCLSPQRWGADMPHHVFYLLYFYSRLRSTGKALTTKERYTPEGVCLETEPQQSHGDAVTGVRLLPPPAGLCAPSSGSPDGQRGRGGVPGSAVRGARRRELRGALRAHPGQTGEKKP